MKLPPKYFRLASGNFGKTLHLLNDGKTPFGWHVLESVVLTKRTFQKLVKLAKQAQHNDRGHEQNEM